MEIYTVKSGDTVFSIANEYGVNVRRLISDNGLTSPNDIVVGQSLLILFPEVIHIVKVGETIIGIADLYGVTVMQLYRNNPTLINEPFLQEGASIVISFTDKPTQSAMVSGFVYSFVNPVIFEAALPYLTYSIHFGYGYDDNGNIITIDDEYLISLAKAYKTSVLLSLSAINIDGSFGTEKIEKLLTDINFQNKVITGMIDTIKQREAQGMDIDFEFIPTSLKVEYGEFIENAAAQLNAAGLVLNVDLAPKTSADQSGLLYEAHDYDVIGNAADFVFLMAYEWGYTYHPTRQR